jgi:hypothetical protein
MSLLKQNTTHFDVNSFIVDAKWLRASLAVRSRHVWGRGDRKTIAQRERERKQCFPCTIRCETVRSRLQKYHNGGQLSSKCFQLYYTCSDRLLAIALPPCSFYLFSPLTVTFILRPLYLSINLSTCGLFNDAISSSDYTEYNYRMINKRLIERHMEKCSSDPI